MAKPLPSLEIIKNDIDATNTTKLKINTEKYKVDTNNITVF